jgi:DNA-binding PadR family transcriptional regulator
VSVRNSLLAILTMGPAYGFQLHGELASRTAGRRTVNVGQVYATLELVDQGAVRSAGTTADGLPLYGLTPAGRTEALDWLNDTASSAGAEWNEMLERVLIASSLAHVDLGPLLRGYRNAWQQRLDEPDGAEPGDVKGQSGLSAAADRAQAVAALAWLDTVLSRLRDQAGDTPLHRELSLVRPRRGRRPTAAAQPG